MSSATVGRTLSPAGTPSAPPGRKSCCRSTAISARFIFSSCRVPKIDLLPSVDCPTPVSRVHLPAGIGPSGRLVKREFGLMTEDIPETILGKDDLPQLVSPGPETGGTGKQVVGPHAVKGLIVQALEPVPVSGEIVEPDHQRLVVIGAEAVPVLQHEQPFGRLAD